MSSTYNSNFTSTSFNRQPHSSHEPTDDLGLNSRQLSTAASDSTLLSPSNYSQTFSNSASPSFNTNSTPGESLPEDSNYQVGDLEDFDDDFLGVNFDAGVQRVDSIPAALLGGVPYQSEDFNYLLTDLPTPPEKRPSSQNLNRSESYPLSPKITSKQSAPSQRNKAANSREKSTASQHESNIQQPNLQFHPLTPLSQHDSTTRNWTPDYSTSSQMTAKGADPVTMAGFGDSNYLSNPQWHSQSTQLQTNTFLQPDVHYSSASHSDYFTNQLSVPPGEQVLQASGYRNDEGMPEPRERTGRAGLDPDSRNKIADVDVPNLKEQDERRRIDEKNIEIQAWRSQASGSSDTNDEVRDEAQNIEPVDDAASIRENKLVEDQVYFNFKSATPTNADLLLMRQPRHWFDAPTLPHKLATKLQPPTSNDAMRKWEANADAFSMTSRVATWGTRRRSEPSLADMDAIADGSFLKKLAISKPKEGDRHRSNSILDQGFGRLASLVRNRSVNLRKRSRSPDNAAASRHNTRSSSFGKKIAPSVNTTFAVKATPVAGVGTAHKPTGSLSPARTSPKSPTHLSFARSVIQRARSRSELSQQDKMAAAGIVDLWRGQGGPPVPNLSSPPLEVEASRPRAEVYDQGEDDDDDDEQGDENDVDIKPEQQSEPIVPSYDGFKAHVRRLNPDMDNPEFNWLVSRIGRQQETRYKTLLELRVNHFRAVMARNCPSRNLCKAHSGAAPLLDVKGYPLQARLNTSDLQLVTEFSDDSLSSEAFPPGVPMPYCRTLPAEFECQLCFKAKKFQKPSDWTKHVHEDLQPFTCTFNKCKEPKSFKRKADWVRHENERHRRLEWWQCEVNDCGHICYRKDNFLQHLVREHKYLEPRQKTKAAIKKAHSAEPAWDMLERCHHETTDKPQDEPCKFCGKIFNSWKKLMVHHGKHMEQISLPVLRLVDAASVDGNTIISPIDQNLTPVTPNKPKMEPASPFIMDSVPLHGTTVPQFTPSYIPTTSSSTMYDMTVPIPQSVSRNQGMIYPNSLGAQSMNQPQDFNFLNSNSLHGMNSANTYMSMDPGFSSNLPEQTYSTSQPNGYSIPSAYTPDAPSVPGYQVPYTLRIADPPLYNLEPIDQSGAQDFHQVPMSRAQGSVSSYGYSGQNVPLNSPYYGNPQ